ncbi:SDR family NAD(P)-dependent oxidoreductase, partial [Plantactinospora siamensis]
GHLGTLETDTIDDIRAVVEVNFFGVLTVTRAALPHLRASRGRIITISSVGGVVGQPFNEAYCAAKFAVEGYLESLYPVLARHGVTVVIVEPGAVGSEFVANVGGGDAAERLDRAGRYAPQLRAYLDRTAGAFANAQTPQDAAATVLTALTADQPQLRLQTSDTARQFTAIKLADLDGSRVTGLTTTWLD